MQEITTLLQERLDQNKPATQCRTKRKSTTILGNMMKNILMLIISICFQWIFPKYFNNSSPKRTKLSDTTDITHPDQTITRICHLCNLNFKRKEGSKRCICGRYVNLKCHKNASGFYLRCKLHSIPRNFAHLNTILRSSAQFENSLRRIRCNV